MALLFSLLPDSRNCLTPSSGLAEWLREHMLTCPSKHLFKVDCPGCGMQRSLVALLEGDLQGSLSLYPALIPTFLLFLFTASHLVFKFKHGAGIIKWGYIACTALVMIPYLYKMANLILFR